MNCKKTWFGYVNSLLGFISFGVLIIALVYLNCQYNMNDYFKDPNSGLVDSNLGIEPWMALLFGVFSLIVVLAFYVFFRKTREFFYKKMGFFSTDLAGEVVGGLISFIIFAAGLFLRVKACLDANVDGISENVSVNLDHCESLFMSNNIWNFDSFNSFYDSCISFIYKFSGIKINAYLWFNLLLHVLIMIFIYVAVRNIFNSAVSVLPLAYIALTPDCIKNVVNGGYGLLEIILFILGFVIITSLIPLFSELDNYHIINLILTLVCELVIIVALPILFKINEFKAPYIPENIDSKLSKLDFPLNNNLIFLVIIAFCLFASISFFFTYKDKISLIMPLFIISTFFYFCSDNSWPSVFVFSVVLYTFAGLGFDELLLSRIHIETKPNDINSISIVDGIEKPELKNITDEINDEEIEVPEATEEIVEDIGEEKIEEIIETEDTENTEEPINEEVTEEIILFESPLPLPKKKVRKQIDYSIEPSEDKMNFDVDIDENDDFDV